MFHMYMSKNSALEIQGSKIIEGLQLIRKLIFSDVKCIEIV